MHYPNVRLGGRLFRAAGSNAAALCCAGSESRCVYYARTISSFKQLTDGLTKKKNPCLQLHASAADCMPWPIKYKSHILKGEFCFLGVFFYILFN